MKKLLTVGAFVGLLVPFTGWSQSVRDAVIAAENSFDAQAAKAGTPAAFLANSAPTAVVGEQGRLANAQEVWKARPAKPGSRLAWYPVWADAAQSGELGYTTGPWTLIQNDRPAAAGEYVTVWRKQPDGQWKFVVDMGVERAAIGVPAPASPVPRPQLVAGPGTPSAAPANLVLDLDRKFAAAEMKKPGASYQEFLSAEARLYRPDQQVLRGAAAAVIMKNLEKGYTFGVTDGYLAASGDLGYVVGTLHRSAASPVEPEENGSYLRIWRREAVTGWRVVLEIFNLEPGPAAAAAGGTGAVTDQSPSKRGQ